MRGASLLQSTQSTPRLLCKKVRDGDLVFERDLMLRGPQGCSGLARSER